jgi:hypothetical protein
MGFFSERRKYVFFAIYQIIAISFHLFIEIYMCKKICSVTRACRAGISNSNYIAGQKKATKTAEGAAKALNSHMRAILQNLVVKMIPYYFSS